MNQDQLKINWASQESIEQLFPPYRREQLKMDKEGKPRSKVVEIRGFSLRNPNNTDDIFVNTSLIVEQGKRCAIYGANGSGKTCLFEAISSGNVYGFPTYMHVHHMKELDHNADKDDKSVLDTVLTAHEYRNALLYAETELKKLIEKGGENVDAYNANLEIIQKQKLSCHGDNAEKVARGMLRVLGFDEVGEKAPLSSLSGGLRMRVALACAFFIDPEILLLDEPTNHLDLPSVLWLENKLRGYKGAFLLVTHDRQLLENVVTSVMLIQDHKLENYPMDFKKFEVAKEVNDKAREKMVTDFLKRNKTLNAMSPIYKTMLEYREWQRKRTEHQILLQGKFTFSQPKPLPCPEGVKQSDISLIKVTDVRFSYDEKKGLPFIFDNPISYNVTQRTRVGIMGPNGAGKSTFLKLITGKLQPTSGTIETNPDFVLAYFGQHSTKELDLDKSAIEFMQWSFPKEKEGVLRQHLMKTSVGEATMESRMKNLSFSQRSCVIFAKLTFVPPHLLIMDEPTNFLDLDSVDSLIKAANKFKGGLIVVTHNRDFLKRTTDSFLSIVPMAFLEFDTMKEAERATYSFITALEEGKDIDVKKAIQDNRGGGAVHTEADLLARQNKLNAQQQKAKDEADALENERIRLETIKLEKEKKRAAKLAAQKTDWVAGDECWAPIGGKFVFVKVLRNVPAMGVTVILPSGKNAMVDAKKLKLENPESSDSSTPAEATKPPARSTSPKRPNSGSNETGASKSGRGGSASRGGRGASRGGRGRGRDKDISFEDLTYSINGRVIIDKVSGTFHNKRLTGIMGNSGAGKTTLLNLLAGEIEGGEISGNMKVNDLDVSSSEIREFSGFLYQDEVILDTMTVMEAIQMAATLKLNRNIPQHTKSKRIDDIIVQLSLEKIVNTVIGDVEKKGISGGERKRVALAMEMVTDPNCLFLDEPTSGLDSFTAYNVMEILKKLARSGRTIITTIHQPSSDIFHLFDDLCLLADGKIVYFGEANKVVEYFDNLGFKCPVFCNPADFIFMNVLNKNRKNEFANQPVDSLNRIPYLVEKWKEHCCKPSNLRITVPKTSNAKAADFKATFMTQTKFLFARAFRNVIRNQLLSTVKFFQAIFIGLLLSSIYYNMDGKKVNEQLQNRPGAFFFLTVNLIMSGAFSSLNILAAEKRVFIREYRNGFYSLPAFFISKILVELPFQIFFPLLTASISYFLIFNYDGLRFFYYSCFVVLLALNGQSVGFCVSSLFSDPQIALVVTPVVILPLMLFAGLFVNLDSVPVYFSWIKYISMMKYGFEGFMKSFYQNWTVTEDGKVYTGDAALKMFSLDQGPTFQEDAVILVGFYFILLTLSYIFLYMNTRRKAIKIK